jgi:DNA-binding response OmpR family regulator
MRRERDRSGQTVNDGYKTSPLGSASLVAMGAGHMHSVIPPKIEKMLQAIEVLIVDDNQYMRRVIRNLLTNLGVKNVYEAADGIAGLEAIRTFAPDIVLLDWEMPQLNGLEFVRKVRAPGVFPMPDVPIIMVSAFGQRWRIIEATRLGVNEFLKKPVSAKALLDRIVAILARPRPMVQLGEYYGPEPRKLYCDTLDIDTAAATGALT